MEWPFNDTFKKGLRNALTGLWALFSLLWTFWNHPTRIMVDNRGTSNAFGVPYEKSHKEASPSKDELVAYGEETWEVCRVFQPPWWADGVEYTQVHGIFRSKRWIESAKAKETSLATVIRQWPHGWSVSLRLIEEMSWKEVWSTWQSQSGKTDHHVERVPILAWRSSNSTVADFDVLPHPQRGMPFPDRIMTIAKFRKIRYDPIGLFHTRMYAARSGESIYPSWAQSLF